METDILVAGSLFMRSPPAHGGFALGPSSIIYTVDPNRHHSKTQSREPLEPDLTFLLRLGLDIHGCVSFQQPSEPTLMPPLGSQTYATKSGVCKTQKRATDLHGASKNLQKDKLTLWIKI
ncbi:hypothetical protein L1887_06096 [Cichorium endivia]|nr:hypothetical protein L1887_06096 [Cichorium endivia]